MKLQNILVLACAMSLLPCCHQVACAQTTQLTFEQWCQTLSADALARRNERLAGLKTKQDVLAWAGDLRHWYQERVGPIVPLDGPQKKEFHGRIDRDGYHVEKWLFETMPGTWTSAHLYVPAKPNAAGVGIVAPIGHWHSGKFCKDYQRLGAFMAHNGVAVLVYDHPGLGERREFWDPVRDESRTGNSPTCEHDRTGLPMATAGLQPSRFYLTEAIRARQFLASFPFVKADKIGFTGASGGGSMSRLLACYLDDAAFSIPVVIIRDQSIGGMGDAEQAVWGDGTRGVSTVDLLATMVPRPVMIVSEIPTDGSKDSYATLRKLYDLAGAPAEATDYYAEATTHGYHTFMIERVFAFLARQYDLGAPDPDTWSKVKALDASESDITAEGLIYQERTQITLLDRIRLMLPTPKGLTLAKLPEVLAISDWQRAPLAYRTNGTIGPTVQVTGAKRMAAGQLGLLDLDPPPTPKKPSVPVLAELLKPVHPATKPAAEPVELPPVGMSALFDLPDCDAQRLLTHFDRSLVGLRVRQILDFAADHPEVQTLEAEGPTWAVPLAFAAPLLPDTVKKVQVKYLPASFRAIVTADPNTTSPGLYIQGLLLWGDVDDVVKLAGQRLAVQYRIDADGRVIAP